MWDHVDGIIIHCGGVVNLLNIDIDIVIGSVVNVKR